jgi:hypothetical protein
MIVAYAAATNLDFLAAPHGGPARPRHVHRIAASPGATYLARALYLAAPPAAALALRVTSPRAMGLTLPYSPVAAGVSVLLVAGAAFVALGTRLLYDRASGQPLLRPGARLAPAAVAWLVLDAVLLETHWAFFRSATSPHGAATSAAVFAALGLLAIESWSNPWKRSAMTDPERVHTLTAPASMAIASALVFLASGSTIFALVLHVVVVILIASLLPGATARTEPRDRIVVEPEPTVV